MTIHFVDAPPERCSDPALPPFIAALKTNTGRWAIYPGCEYLSREYRRVMAARINNPHIPRNPPPTPFRGGGFEAMTRGKVLYVRWIGHE